MALPLFWLALVSQLIIVVGYFWFYRKEQLCEQFLESRGVFNAETPFPKHVRNRLLHCAQTLESREDIEPWFNSQLVVCLFVFGYAWLLSMDHIYIKLSNLYLSPLLYTKMD
jgi:hypothetical protein